MRVNKKPTKGHLRLKNHFNDVLITRTFISGVAEIRHKYSIPENGYNAKKMKLSKDVILITPPEWSKRFPPEMEVFKLLKTDIKSLCEKIKLHGTAWEDAVEEYVFWNTQSQLDNLWPEYDLCLIGDTTDKELKKMFPIVIRVSQYAPISNIVEFLERNKKDLLAFQEPLRKSDINLSGVRSKKQSNKQRDEFIYKNKNLPLKRIRRMLVDQFKVILDEGEIGKIISIQKKRREK